MPQRFSFQFLFISIGIALLFAGLFFDGGIAQSPKLQTTPAPTQDRLAEPTLPPSPAQADRGAQVYWLSCLPCHGDKGQGLTDEFRAIYPPEENYCWESGCHGVNPYESGFTIPKFIPGVIGPAALSKFSNAAQLNSYIRAAMPYWKPGSLTEDEAWKVTAFLLRENNLWTARDELNASNADKILVNAPTAVATPQPPPSAAASWILSPLLFIVGFIVLILLLIFLRIFRKK